MMNIISYGFTVNSTGKITRLRRGSAPAARHHRHKRMGTHKVEAILKKGGKGGRGNPKREFQRTERLNAQLKGMTSDGKAYSIHSVYTKQ